MKTNIFKFFGGAILCSCLLTSCYTYTTIVGEGAKGTQEVKKWNSYVLFGLIPVGVSNPKQLAGETKDYNVKTSHSFVNGLVAGLTFGIYTPTTTTVQK